MSEFGDGTASGDYDNETASIIEKRLERKQREANAKASAEKEVDKSDASLDTWESDGGRRSDEPPTGSRSTT